MLGEAKILLEAPLVIDLEVDITHDSIYEPLEIHSIINL